MITPRLKMILNNISGVKIADIGTDHAYIPIELAKAGKKVIATDIHKGPLVNAEKNIKKFGLDISLRQGAGLKLLNPTDAEEIIIAGMGGEMIEKIISEDYTDDFSSRLILQPMNSQAELRYFLYKNGFKITGEDLAQEGFKIYNLIICEKGASALPQKEIYYHLPPVLFSHALFPLLAEKKRREFTKCLEGQKKSKMKNPSQIEHLAMLLSETEKIIKGEKI